MLNFGSNWAYYTKDKKEKEIDEKIYENRFKFENEEEQGKQEEEEKTQLETKKIKFEESNLNVLSADLDTLENECKEISGDVHKCKGCDSIFNKHSEIKQAKAIENQIIENTSVWSCEFCGVENVVEIIKEEIPKDETVEYILETSKGKVKNEIDDGTVIFILDISGSMSEIVEIPDNPKKIRLSRYNCVVESVKSQIETLRQDFPKKKVGLICFNEKILVLGDGSNEIETISEDFEEFDLLLEKSQKYTLNNPIEKSSEDILKKLSKIKENGVTALGPALVVGLGMAISNNTNGSSIVLLTDGCANSGLGDLSKSDQFSLEKADKFYTKIGEIAQHKGTTISITSLEGTNCNMQILGKITEISNGVVDIVNPLDITGNFEDVIENKIVATQCSIAIKASKQVKIEEKDCSFKKYVGNVTKDLSVTLEYSFKEDLVGQILFFQLQITYRDLKGVKKLRCITKSLKVTNDRKLAEEELNFDVISANTIQNSAKIAKKGEYSEAKKRLFSSSIVLGNVCKKDSNLKEAYSTFCSKAKELDTDYTNQEQEDIKYNQRQSTYKTNTYSNNLFNKSCYSSSSWTVKKQKKKSKKSFRSDYVTTNGNNNNVNLQPPTSNNDSDDENNTNN
eukprot:TRINITY_DN4604_c0_g1_i1.p1 TRINITY_DN4604_c0_g1~~TRINITY_DN4604_c0_g1_i1.p1  ORF type:complete len:624 (-),score=193.39 TRINITY_DN4604_c0_g1_i1:69-1940(-)